jgi:sorbitol/mannitol transport system permease protein
LLIFFPILWTILTSFKTEARRSTTRRSSGFDWTLENYGVVQERSDYMRFLWNSVIIAGGSTLLGILHRGAGGLVDGLRAVEAHQGHPAVDAVDQDAACGRRALPDLPAVHAVGLLDTRGGLILVLMLINLPIIVWMLYTYFKEIPGEILEAARMDGAGLREEILYVLTPMAIPGIASTILLNFILAWNEAFWTLNLTAANAAPLTAFIASYSSPEGLFFAKLSAASTMAIAPILILGWFSQKQLVRGLTFGAVK